MTSDRIAAAATTAAATAAAAATTTTTPPPPSAAAKRQLPTALFTLSPIAEAERFTLEMPPTPSSPMDVDSTTTTTEAAVAPSRTPSPPARPLLSVFDWDDTLCPSWWLHRRGALECSAVPAISERGRQRLAQLETHVLALLQRALAVGPVFIITAATLQWVEACAARFLPRVRAFLAQQQQQQPHGVRVVSAREWFQQHVRREGDPRAWKLATFDALCAHLQLDRVHRQLRRPVDFVSIGDSVFERDACRQLERKAPAIVHSKTLKFVDRPSLQELLDQVTLTTALFDRIRSHGGSLDLLITRAAHRQKGDPTLRIVQVDLSPQQLHAAKVAEAPTFVQARSRVLQMGVSSS